MKRLSALLAFALVCLGVAVSAAAYTTKPPTAVHALIVCYKHDNVNSSYTLGGYGDGNGAITAGSPFYLRIGYAAATQKEVLNFLGAQSGSITVKDSSGTTVKTVTWSTGATQYWAQPTKASLTTTTGAPLLGFAATLYAPIGSLAAGSYTVDVDIELASQVYDGETYQGPGTWFSTAGCPMTIS